MLRLASKTPFLARLTASTSCGFRFQSSVGAAVADATNTDYNQQSDRLASQRSRRWRVPTWLLPRFEIHDIRDDPTQGNMTRIAVDNKQLLVLQYPQRGMRKMDPNDETPQFDLERRISVRLRHRDLGGLVAVVEGRLRQYAMKNNAYDLVFEKTSEGGYILGGSLQRTASKEPEPWSIRFDTHFGVTIEHFLENALTESFGFSSFLRPSSAEAGRGERSLGGGRAAYRNNQRQRSGGNPTQSKASPLETIE